MRVLPILFLILACNVSNAKEIKVCSTCANTTIKQAIAFADSGDVILLDAGVYLESDLEITKPLSIIGNGKAIIDGNKVGEIFGITSENVRLSGLTIKNVGISYVKDFAAIRLYKADHFVIEDNILETVFFGILVEKTSHGIIRRNTISSTRTTETNAGNGIHLWHCSDILIDHNHVHGVRDGIYFEFVNNSHISGNVSEHNLRYGLHFMFSNNDEYTDNTFRENSAGVAVMFSKFVTMKRNKFYMNWGSASYGLLLKEIYDAEIVDNTFEKNTIGINAEGSNRVNYTHNTFKANGWAVKVRGACYANVFKANNFISNSFDISYSGNVNDNRFEGNYWAEYTGYDLDKNGIGDVPYRPVKLFSYVVNRTPETIVLLRSLFVDIINFSEKVSPVFTPDKLVDDVPKMKMIL